MASLRSVALLAAAVIFAAPLCACDDSATLGGDSGDDSGDGVPPPDAGADDGVFKRCTGRTFTPAPKEAWRHDVASPLIVASGAANHSAQDVIVVPGAPTAIVGKFTYGAVSKDLEDEDVRVVLDTCGAGWVDLGRATTDSDGRIAHDVTVGLGVGVYEARLQVLGDQTLATTFVWVLPADTRLALTDIDGTMTESDAELFMQILDGSHVPVAYPGAVDLTTTHAERGHVVVYLTGRPYWLQGRTREWLRDLGFAPGPLHVTDSNEEAAPTEAGVGDFKKAWIAGLLASGWRVDVAYGNATTDIYAYLGAGLPADDVWIIGDNGGMMGTHAVTASWEARVSEVAVLPVVQQPFTWP